MCHDISKAQLEKFAWLHSEMALAAFNQGALSDCIEYATRGVRMKRSEVNDDRLRAALSFNGMRCLSKMKESSQRSLDEKSMSSAGCFLGQAESCRRLGELSLNEARVEAFRLGCKMNDAQSCFRLGSENLVADFPGRIKAYQLSCSLGYRPGCDAATATEKEWPAKEKKKYFEIQAENEALAEIEKRQVSAEKLRRKSSQLSLQEKVRGFSCGNEGSVKQRIVDCASKNFDREVRKSLGENTWRVVSRAGCTEKSCYEVWIDEVSGLLWTDVLTDEVTWFEATGSEKKGAGGVTNATKVSVCEEKPAYTTPLKYAPMKGYLSGIRWRLPSIEEWEESEKHGIRTVFDKNTWYRFFWSSSVISDEKNTAWQFNGWGGRKDNTEYRDGRLPVRCVGTQ